MASFSAPSGLGIIALHLALNTIFKNRFLLGSGWVIVFIGRVYESIKSTFVAASQLDGLGESLHLPYWTLPREARIMLIKSMEAFTQSQSQNDSVKLFKTGNKLLTCHLSTQIAEAGVPPV